MPLPVCVALVEHTAGVALDLLPARVDHLFDWLAHDVLAHSAVERIVGVAGDQRAGRVADFAQAVSIVEYEPLAAMGRATTVGIVAEALTTGGRGAVAARAVVGQGERAERAVVQRGACGEVLRLVVTVRKGERRCAGVWWRGVVDHRARGATLHRAREAVGGGRGPG